MDVIQDTKATRAGGRVGIFGPSFLIAAVLVGAVVAVVLAMALVLRSSTGQPGVAAGDPLLQPAIVQFRQSEHAEAVAPGDPLLQPAIVQFRQSEHAEAASR